jgi:hypothetical protein
MLPYLSCTSNCFFSVSSIEESSVDVRNATTKFSDGIVSFGNTSDS